MKLPECAVDYMAFADTHLVTTQKINTRSKKTPTYTVEGTTTIRIKITFEESNFKLILTWQQCEDSSEKIFGQRLLTAS